MPIPRIAEPGEALEKLEQIVTQQETMIRLLQSIEKALCRQPESRAPATEVELRGTKRR